MRLELVDEAKKPCAAWAAVQQCYYVASETDLILVLSVRSMVEYETLTRRLFSVGNVRRFRTSVVIDRVKSGLRLPLGPRASGL